MTLSAQQREHAAWMRFRRTQLLDEIQERIKLLSMTFSHGWESRPHEKIGDMIARLEWLRTATCASGSTSSTDPTTGPDGNARPIEPQVGPTSSRVA